MFSDYRHTYSRLQVAACQVRGGVKRLKSLTGKVLNAKINHLFGWRTR